MVLEEVAVDAVDCAELRDILHQNRGLQHQPSHLAGAARKVTIGAFNNLSFLLFNVVCSLPSKASLCLDDILVSSTRGLQHLANVPERLLRLCSVYRKLG